ncbi:molecular chaperone HscC [Anaerosphaera aminiphila DSM 21120]|uniref:Chaperone protein DnaK n=1 Tax=Anaerosphaera aminiphila DSM 21120 TaxID=1120995 RepID=A0A1M5PFR1_9FIRM|nr:Hsp70 family protein [Anaerosphaera aminiphila]SHH00557.1 molecular chaperone HscC [Anaerosphaera aminiphila DSM 21120]
MATIGIDLGTSNSMVTYWNGKNGEVIKNVLGNVLTPSIISVDESGEILIGEIAKERLITYPDKTVSAFKRFMGTKKIYSIGKHEFSPIELSSIILKKLKEDAESYLNESCDSAVISVPAYFNNAQREATLAAAKLAGIDVLNLISEPTAAAISYGLYSEIDSTILVLDLGGGTFDVSLLEIFEGIIQVNAISGDNKLGGEDFTNEIVKDFLRKTQLKEDILNLEFMSLLRKKCEHLKLNLSEENLSFNIEYRDVNYEYSLNIGEFDKLVVDLLERIKTPIIKAIKDSQIKVEDIDKVILIGGATKSESVRKYITKLFNKFPYISINPDEAVGIGAGIQTALKLRDENLSEVILTDVCAHTLGIETTDVDGNIIIDGLFSPIIERNTTIPVSIIKRFYKLYDRQEVINVLIYQGESNKVEDNLFLSKLSIPIERENDAIDVRFTYDGNGVLEVDVEVVNSSIKKRLVIEENPGTLTQAEIEEILIKLEQFKVHPREKSENRYLLERASRLYVESLGEKRSYIGNLITKFEITLEKQIPEKIKEEAEELNNILNTLEREIF